MTYNKFRGAYLKACLANEQVDPFDDLDYARSILGDYDESTIRANQRFEIKHSEAALEWAENVVRANTLRLSTSLTPVLGRSS